MSTTATVREPEQEFEVHSPAPCFIINIAKERWVTTTSLGTFIVPGREKGKEYSVLRVSFHRAVMDLGDNKRSYEHVNAVDIATDLVRVWQAEVDKDGMSRGLFVSFTEKPSAADFERERAKYKRYLQYLVDVADTDWLRYHRVDLIEDAAKRAVLELGFERGWAKAPTRKVACTYCGEPVMPNVAQCKHCGSILNHDLWAKMQPNQVIRVKDGLSWNSFITSFIKRFQRVLKSHFRR